MTRATGLAALAAFVPRAGHDYSSLRNYDRGPGVQSTVSGLSPYLRHRLITEREVIAAVLASHSAAAAGKFIQEVFWRTYWKGWLELRPEVYSRYQGSLAALLESGVGGAYDRACRGETGIDCFDAWVAELTSTGYLHNHSRMDFASIWIFTLGLPWELGADFFYRHLLDGDPASNTLSWRWVAGLQTVGKTYLTDASNIARCTGGRFNPVGLATVAPAVSEATRALPGQIPDLVTSLSSVGPAVGLLLHEEDLHPESLELDGVQISQVAGCSSVAGRSPLPVASLVAGFTERAVADGLSRASAHFDAPATVLDALTVSAVRDWTRAGGISSIVTPYAPVGPVRERLDVLVPELAASGISLVRLARNWDREAWPHASKGFFPFRERIPKLLAAQNL
jgi:deoxyribodipyrimidine photo-lyase